MVVGGRSEFDTKLLEAARKQFQPYEGRLSFRYLTALPMQELLTELSQLPPRTIVLYTTFFQDGAGQAFVPHDVAERVSKAASVPVYGFLDQYLGRGIVGGNLYSLAEHGAKRQCSPRKFWPAIGALSWWRSEPQGAVRLAPASAVEDQRVTAAARQ